MLLRKEATRPLILVTNDDGIGSPGLRAAIGAIHDLGEIWVVAPRQQQSAMGRSFPYSNGEVHPEEIWIGDKAIKAFSVDGSPAISVAYALFGILPRLPDIAISGINYGENVGSGITGSGTVGAALEAAAWRVPSLAISLETEPRYYYTHSEEVDFNTAALVTRRFTAWLLRHSLPEGVDILKIDVPNDATPQTPWRLTRVSRQTYYYPKRRDNGASSGPLDYEIRVDRDTLEPDSDIAAVICDRVISVAPLTIDLSAHKGRDALEKDLRNLEWGSCLRAEI